jgi:hypothetical protein
MPQPTFNQVLLALKSQIIVGKTYLSIAEGLIQSQQEDPIVQQIAPVFFGLMINGSLEHAQMTIARLYDKSRGSVTVPRMLEQATENIASFVRGDVPQIADLVAQGKRMVAELEPVILAIRTRRDKRLAHLDPHSVADPNAYAQEARLTFPDLREAFKKTESLLIDVSSLHDGTVGDLRFVGGEDYKVVLHDLRRYKCAVIEAYEKTYHVDWGPLRPKDCAKSPSDLI